MARSRKSSANPHNFGALVAAVLCLLPEIVSANPTGGQVTAGSATITESGKVLDVNQSSNKAVIDWRGFDIDKGETTNFKQPTSSSITLNRVNSSTPSQIFGTLNANGNIVILNQNGVLFGAGSKVNVNSIVATTADIDNSKFMNNDKLVFDKPGNATASITNNGTITAKQAGMVGFVAPNVINNGVINANLGTVHLASGDKVTIDFYGDKLMEVAVGDNVQSQLVENTGTINASGGKINLTAAASGKIVNSLINVKGELNAPTISQHNGVITIGDGGNAQVNITGKVSAKGTKRNQSGGVINVNSAYISHSGTLDASGDTGGTINITGQTIAEQGQLLAKGATGKGGSINIAASDGYLDSEDALLSVASSGNSGGSIILGSTNSIFSSASFDASGHYNGGLITLTASAMNLFGAHIDASGQNGGTIEIGGDWQGSGTLAHAQTTSVNTTTKLDASGTNGEGGKIVVWSDQQTQFGGEANASGKHGNGGKIEVSSHDHLTVTDNAVTNAGSVGGLAGDVLFDPHNITIAQGGTGGFEGIFELTSPYATASFGNNILTLGNGNIVVTDPNSNFGCSYGCGAAYLFDGTTGGLISTLTGNTNDSIGNRGIFDLKNGNYLIDSSQWSGGFYRYYGAVTWGSGTTGVSGLVSSSNSIVGSHYSDYIGNGGAVILANGNYLVDSPYWGDGTHTYTGAVTWGNGSTGTSGVVSAANSLVGSYSGEYLGSGSYIFTALSNGAYVINDPYWTDTGHSNLGMAIWGSASSGVSGTISSANALVGTRNGDEVSYGTNGQNGVVKLANGNYVVNSQDWNDGTHVSAGAVTWGSASAGVSGTIASANSLIGSHNYDNIGSYGITALTNGNYVVDSPAWDDGIHTNVGAVTWGNGTSGTTGLVSSSNSLVGARNNDQVGYTNITALTNGNYVVDSVYYNGIGDYSHTGAVTWGNGLGGTVGNLSLTNSLIGSFNSEYLGNGGITALTNGNYVVRSTNWNDGSHYSEGAVTWANGSGGTVGNISAANSLVGSHNNDYVGSNGITALANGNYVVDSSSWSDGVHSSLGAATWGNGTTGVKGVVSSANSLIGSQNNDRVGSTGVTALDNGNYVVNSAYWNNGNMYAAGASTWGNGATGITGIVSTANSIVGGSSNSYVGNNGIKKLLNGNYLILSQQWNDGSKYNEGAVTWANGNGGAHGVVSASNSLVGNTSNESLGNGGIVTLTNGNYLVGTPYWNDGSKSYEGAVTWGNGSTGTSGVVSASNSLVGSHDSDYVGLFSNVPAVALSDGNYVLNNSSWNQSQGAVTFGNGTTGTSGVIGDTNSLIGAHSQMSGSKLADDAIDGNYVLSMGGHVYVISENGPSPYSGNAVLGDYDSFGDSAGADVTLAPSFLTRTLDNGTNVTLQANNDITVNSSIFASQGGGDLTLMAGRNINLNASIDTGGGDFTAIANATAADGVISAYRDAGSATISLANYVSVNAGAGTATFEIRDGSGNQYTDYDQIYLNGNNTITAGGGIHFNSPAALTGGPVTFLSDSLPVFNGFDDSSGYTITFAPYTAGTNMSVGNDTTYALQVSDAWMNSITTPGYLNLNLGDRNTGNISVGDMQALDNYSSFTLASGHGDITFNNAIDGNGYLSVQTSGNVVFKADIGDITPLSYLYVEGDSGIYLPANLAVNDYGNIWSSVLSLNGPMFLSETTNITNYGSGAEMDFYGSIDDTALGAHSLNISSPGGLMFYGIGDSVRLYAVNISGGYISVGDIYTHGGGVTLTSPNQESIYVGNVGDDNGGNLNFFGDVNGDSGYNTASFSTTSGNINFYGTIFGDAWGSSYYNTLNISTDSGSVYFANGAFSNNGNSYGNTFNFTTRNDINIDNSWISDNINYYITSTAGNININSDFYANYETLYLTAAQAINFNANLGSSSNLGGLYVSAQDIYLPASIITNYGSSFSGNLHFTQDTSISDYGYNTISFGNLDDSTAGAHDLNIYTNGYVQTGDIGSSKAFKNLYISGDNGVYTGNIRATGDVSLESYSNYVQTGAIDTPGNVNISGYNGVYTGNIGANTAVASASLYAYGLSTGSIRATGDINLTNNGYSLSTGDIDTSGNVDVTSFGTFSTGNIGSHTQVNNVYLEADWSSLNAGSINARGDVNINGYYSNATVGNINANNLNYSGDYGVESGDIHAAGEVTLTSNYNDVYAGNMDAPGAVSLYAGGYLDTGDIGAHTAAASLNATGGYQITTGNVTTAGGGSTFTGSIDNTGDVNITDTGGGAITLNDVYSSSDIHLQTAGAISASSLNGQNIYLSSDTSPSVSGTINSNKTVFDTYTSGTSMGIGDQASGTMKVSDAILQITNGDLVLGNGNAGDIDISTTTDFNGSVLVKSASGHDITLDNTLSSEAAGNAITLAAGRNFINNAGFTALNTPQGNWLVYATSPTGSSNGGLSEDFHRYSCTYGASCPTMGTGNGFLYTYTPTLNVSANATEITYGDGVPVYTFTVDTSGYLGTDLADDIRSLSGSLFTSTYTQGSNAGQYDITRAAGSLASSLGYGFNYTGLTNGLTVDKKTITASWNGSLEKTYGNANPTVDYHNFTFHDLYGSDSASLFTATANYGSIGTNSNAGTYANGVSASFNAANYIVSNAPTTNLVIGKRDLSITTADKTKTYGDNDPTFTGTVTGLTTYDATTGGVSFAYLPGGYSGNAGNYTIAANATDAGNRLANYNITNNYGTFLVNKALLNVIVDGGQHKTYGANDPLSYTYTYNGLVNGDSSENFTGGLGRAAGSNAGLYAINSGNLAATGNYTIGSFTGANFTIDKALLSITADAKTRAYGDANPNFTATFNGLVNGDNSSVVSGLVMNTAANRNSDVGSYAINLSGGSASNYIITDHDNTLNVIPAVLTVSPNDNARPANTPNPVFTGNISGFKNNQNSSILWSQPIYTSSATTSSGVGVYNINASGASAPNYIFSYLVGQLIVSPPLPSTVEQISTNAMKTIPAQDSGITNSNLGPQSSPAEIEPDDTVDNTASPAASVKSEVKDVKPANDNQKSVMGGLLQIDPKLSWINLSDNR